MKKNFDIKLLQRAAVSTSWLVLLLCLCHCAPLFSQPARNAAPPLAWQAKLDSTACFWENKGQVRNAEGSKAEDVHYVLEQGGARIFLRGDGIAWQFERLHGQEGDPFDYSTADEEEAPSLLETFRMDTRLVGARPGAAPEGAGKRGSYANHYKHGALGAQGYSGADWRNVYPGIEWRVRATGKGIRQEFIVQPGADPSMIKLAFSHQEKLYIDEQGRLVHGNRMGQFLETLLAFGEGGKPIAARFRLEGDELGFELPGQEGGQALLINLEREWGTYYGGGGRDVAWSSAVDCDGSIYLAGESTSSSFIAQSGHQNSYGGGNDAYLAKLTPLGGLEWATYYGGEENDGARSCTVDGQGHVYLAGYTRSIAGIAFDGFQQVHGGGSDAFLAKFNGLGELQWATYYGGGESDLGRACTVDSEGHVYLAGHTISDNDIAYLGHQVIFGGVQDAFLVKFSPSGEREWATYYGGSLNDAGLSCAADQYGNVYLAGWTDSSSGISFSGHQNDTEGPRHAFLAKFSPAGERQWATYYGGGTNDIATHCSTDQAGNVYLAGRTTSDLGIAYGGHQNDRGGNLDGFLAKFSASGQLLWGTYYGGSRDDYIHRCVSNGDDNVYAIGVTRSTEGIAYNGHQNSLRGLSDAFLVKFGPSGEREWATYYGGSGEDLGYCIAADISGNVYLGGLTISEDGIASGGHQEVYGGGNGDAFLAKFGCGEVISSASASACGQYEHNGEMYTSSGCYAQPLGSQGGCDSVEVLSLTIYPVSRVSLSAVACAGEGYTLDGSVYMVSGLYVDTLQSALTGCDSIVELELEVLPLAESTLDTAYCAGSAIEWQGEQISEPGTYEFHYTTASGCDSLLLLEVAELPFAQGTLDTAYCTGSAIEWQGEQISEPGTYEFHYTTASGCDSLLLLEVAELPFAQGTLDTAYCTGSALEWEGSLISEPGTYEFPYSTDSGCDSLLLLQVAELPAVQVTLDTAYCAGEAFYWEGELLLFPGTYEYVYPLPSGCDSTLLLNLERLPNRYTRIDTVLAPGGLYEGQPYSGDTLLSFVLPAANGCDSLVEVYLSVVTGSREVAVGPMSLQLYPNPTTSTLYLKAKLPSSAPALLTVQDAMGRELLRQPLPAGSGQHELDVSAWPAGVYFLRLRQGEVEVVERFVKGE